MDHSILKQEKRRAIVVSLFSPFMFSLLCMTIHYGNIVECTENSFFLLLFFLLAPCLWGAVFFVIQWPFFGKKYFSWINLSVFLTGVLLWFQANLFNWGFSSFNGTIVNWEVYRPFMYLELFFQAVLIFFVFFFRGYFAQKTVFYSFLLLSAQFMSLFWTAAPVLFRPRAADQDPVSWIKYDTDESGKFTFSKNENIILLVIDSFPGFTAERIFNDFPELKHSLSDFTFFKNCRSFPGGTTVNVPAILTGQVIGSEVGTTEEYFADTDSDFPEFISQAYNGPLSVPKILKEKGFYVELYPEVRGTVCWDDRVIDNAVLRQNRRIVRYKDDSGQEDSCFQLVMNAAVFRICPVFMKKNSNVIKKYCFWNAEQTFRPFEKETDPSCFPDRNRNDPDSEFTQRIRSKNPLGLREQKTFKYIHLFGVHVPHQRESSAAAGCIYDPDNKNAAAEFTLELGYLRLVENFIEKLKKQNIYDNSTIVVMGDHTQHYSLLTNTSLHDYPTFDPRRTFFNNPLLLIKRSGNRNSELRTVSDYIETSDLASFLIKSANFDRSKNSSFFDLSKRELEKRSQKYSNLLKNFYLDLNTKVKTVHFQKEDLFEQKISEHRTGNSFFLFCNQEFSELILFGDQDRPWKRSFFLRAEKQTDPSNNSSEHDQYRFDFDAEIPFRQGDSDSNYKFVKAVFDRDVWRFQCLLNLDNIPDGKYRIGLIETDPSDNFRRETIYNVMLYCRKNVLSVPPSEGLRN